MKNILLPTDFSENSLNAIKYAVQLFKNQECNFILLNTFTPIVYRVEYMETGAAQFGLLDAMKETSKNGLNTVQQKIESEFKNPKHTFSQISSFNMLTTEIDNLYEENAMDLVVMGTQGASGLKEILFGSNTVHVIENTKCPLLAIPNDFTFNDPTEILFPSDYGIDYTEKQLKPIKDITSLYNSKLNFFHVSYSSELSDFKETNRQTLENYFKEIKHSFHTVYDGNIVEEITKFQTEANVDLLVMINNKQSFFENLFFGSDIKRIGFHVSIPFLVIPAKA